ncbi:hypothetical protein BH23BAC1_BH23BAC1_47930 [soil metagenome]
MGNYLKIYFQRKGEIYEEILRNSLKNAETAIEQFPEIIRCHRAYIVNLLKIEDAAGNSQGYKLKFKGVNDEVPVSRKYISDIKQHLQKLQEIE